MSFTERNKNFIQIKFYSNMKGMNSNEKRVHYSSFLRNETISRIKRDLKDIRINRSDETNINENWDLFTSASNDLAPLTNYYFELFKVLNNFDFELIFISLIFETYADKLIVELRKKISQFIPENFEDRFELLKFLEKDSDKKLILKTQLFDKISVTESEILHDDNSRNDISKKMTIWLKAKLCDKGTESNEVERLLFYFSLYWNTKFYNSKTETKGIVLLTKFKEVLDELNYNLKIDVKEVLNKLNANLELIFPDIRFPPFLENTGKAEDRGSTGKFYFNAINEFNALLKNSNTFIIDVTSFDLKILLEKYLFGDSNLQKIIFDEIYTRSNTIIFGKSYLGLICDYVNIVNARNLVDSQGLFSFLIRKFYLFQFYDCEIPLDKSRINIGN